MLQRRAKRPIDITDLLVWVIRDQKADVVDGKGVGLHEGERAADGLTLWRTSPDGVAAVLGNIGVGGKIQKLGYDLGALDPDAEAVWELLRGLPHVALVVRQARAAEPPQGAWLPDPPLVPVWRKGPRFDAEGLPADGTFRVVWDAADGKRPLYCPLQPEHETGYVDVLRTEYRQWRATVEHLARLLIAEPGRLRRWSVNPPRFLDAPWERPALARWPEALDMREAS